MHNIKITSGKFRGRTINSPNLKTTHPMGAREKLALFNILAEYLPNAIVLDAYAGSGALGIEALSRGAKQVVFVEKNPNAAKIIHQNLRNLDLEGNSIVYRRDVSDYLVQNSFDIIVADPPYDNFDITAIENLVMSLKNTGLLVLSHPDEAPILHNLQLKSTRKYAAAHISVYEKLDFSSIK